MNCWLSPAGRKNKSTILYEREMLLLIYCLSICLSWSFVLTRCCVLTWVMKIAKEAISNVHAGRMFPTPAPKLWQFISWYSCVCSAVQHTLTGQSREEGSAPHLTRKKIGSLDAYLTEKNFGVKGPGPLWRPLVAVVRVDDRRPGWFEEVEQGHRQWPQGAQLVGQPRAVVAGRGDRSWCAVFGEFLLMT